MKIGKPNLQIGSDADGDVYYRLSGILARLAKGAANTKQFMNAAGTAPEWARGIKIIRATRDMTASSGDVSYTGVGFVPALIILLAAIDSAGSTMSVGFADKLDGAGGAICDASCGASASSWWTGDGFCYLVTTGSTTRQVGILKTFDADGFTVTWTKTGSPTGTADLKFICFR